MRDSQIPELNSEFQLEKFEDEILLYSISGTKAVYLNETAIIVYGMCSSGQSLGDIISLLEEAYPDQKDTIREDVFAAMDVLLENGALFLRN